MAQEIIVDPNPVFFPGRLILDLTEGKTFPIFGHNLNTGSQKNDLLLFKSAAGEGAPDAGFRNADPLPEGMTNITKRGELPGGGAMKVQAIAIEFEPLKKPDSVADADAVSKIASVGGNAGSNYHTPDIYDGKVLSHAMRLVNAAYRPFLRYGTAGAVTWLPSVSHLGRPAGIKDYRMATVDGPTYYFPKGFEPEWNPSGKGSNLLFGLRLFKDQYNAPWAMNGAAATEPGVSIRTNLGYAAAGAAPAAAGVVIAVLDFTVYFYGTQVARAGN